jgi:Tfp pilus assembly PilM family ATPase
MAGGVANLVNLDNFLSQKLKISTHPGNAWKNLLPNAAVPNEKRAEGLVVASVLGLALRAAQKPW